MLEQFDGVSGYRWAALQNGESHWILSQNAPEMHRVDHLLSRGKTFLQDRLWGNLFFKNGLLLFRLFEGRSLWVCGDPHLEIGLIDAMVNPTEPAARRGADSGSDSQVRLVQSTSVDGQPVPQNVIEELLDIYTQFLGPLARKLAQKEMRKLGFHLDHVPAKSWSVLLNSLASRIDQEVKRDRFIDEAIILKNQF